MAIIMFTSFALLTEKTATETYLHLSRSAQASKLHF